MCCVLSYTPVLIEGDWLEVMFCRFPGTENNMFSEFIMILTFWSLERRDSVLHKTWVDVL
jgi:hypothetical protein